MNPSLSEEERRICYEEEDLPECERPSLSEEKRKSCDNSELEEDQQRFCRDGSLVVTCHNPLPSFFEEVRRTCVRKRGTAKSKVSKRPDLGLEASLQSVILRSDDNLAPLELATSDYGRPDTYIVTLSRGVDYYDHFRTIGRDLEADESTAFKWFQYANAYYADSIASEWVRPFSKHDSLQHL
jgi:hypothetical protein